MIKAYVKAIKYKPQRNLLLFSEILSVLYFREDVVKNRYDSDDSLKAEVSQAFASIFTDTPVWTWAIWMGNLILNVYKKSNLRLDEIIVKELGTAAQNYKAFTHYVLSGCEKKDPELEEVFRVKQSPQFSLKMQEANLNKLVAVFEGEDLHNKNDYPEILTSLYASQTMSDSRQINLINAKCKGLGEGVNQFKNQDNSQRLLGIIKAIGEFLANQKPLIGKRPRHPMPALNSGLRIGLATHTHVYTEKALADFFTEAYLLPEVKVVYEARRFGLQFEFLTTRHKRLVYTLKKKLWGSGAADELQSLPQAPQHRTRQEQRNRRSQSALRASRPDVFRGGLLSEG